MSRAWEVPLNPDGASPYHNDSGWVVCDLVNKAAHPVIASFTIAIKDGDGAVVRNYATNEPIRFEAWSATYIVGNNSHRDGVRC
jgi:hypothetical protein